MSEPAADEWVDGWIAMVNGGGASMAEFVATDARVAAPGGVIEGRDGYVALMAGLLASMGPAARFERSGPVAHHNDWLLFSWRVTGASDDWEGATEGIDVVQRNESGRMVLNIVFPSP